MTHDVPAGGGDGASFSACSLRPVVGRSLMVTNVTRARAQSLMGVERSLKIKRSARSSKIYASMFYAFMHRKKFVRQWGTCLTNSDLCAHKNIDSNTKPIGPKRLCAHRCIKIYAFMHLCNFGLLHYFSQR